MESNTIVNRLNHLAGLKSDSVSTWQDLVKQYPYFSIGRYLQFAAETLHGYQPDMVTLSPYKQNPLKFLHFIDDVHKGVGIETKVAGEKEIQTTVVPVIQAEKQTEQTEQASPEEPVKVAEKQTIVQDVPETITEWPLNRVVTELPVPNHPSMEDLETEQSNTVDDEYSHEAHIQETIEQQHVETIQRLDDMSLMVMMSFTDWLNHFKGKTIREQEEEKEKKALKTAWQKEKLTAVVDEEQEEIPETIFKQAMESISLESSLISESLAGLLAKQGKTDKAIDMYKKLSLRNPEKRAYFADLIKEIHLNNI